MASGTDQGDDEFRERYRELLEELRTVLPGVQVLLGFLLMVPFNGRFSEVDTVGRTLYLVALLGAAASTLVFLTPTALHRVLPREERRTRVHAGVRVALAGMVLLAVSMAAALALVVRFIFETDLLAWSLGAGIAVGAAALWWLVPTAVLDRQD